MEEVLQSLKGKTVNVACGSANTFTGEIVDIKTGVLVLKDEDNKLFYIASDKITFVCESHLPASRPGFIV
jgi:hypothetical protein